MENKHANFVSYNHTVISQNEPRLLEHKNLQTTMIYTHVLHNGHLGVKSPGDTL